MKFAKAVDYYGPVRGPNPEGRYDLDIGHPKFAADLRDKGVIEAKTFKVKYPPFLSQELNRHFIRGVFDGDGTITTHRSRYKETIYESPFMAIVGGVPEFLREIVRILASEVGVKNVKVLQRSVRGEKTGTWAFSYTGAPAMRIRDYLYRDADTFMECKREKFFSFDYSQKRPHDTKLQNDRLKAMIESKGGTLRSDYEGYYGRVKVECDRGHVWRSRYSIVKAGKWCPKCRDERNVERTLRRGKQHLERCLEERGWRLESEYLGLTNDVSIRCQHGVVFAVKAGTATTDTALCDCDRTNTLEHGRARLERLLKTKGWKLASEYTGFFKYVEVVCQHGDRFRRIAGNIKPGSKCECEKRGSSSYVGVYLLPSGRWQAQVRRDGRLVRIGTFDDPEEAARARDDAAIRFMKRPVLNFPKRKTS